MKIFILTEGGRNIGFGHITRCMAVYQGFEEKKIYPHIIVNNFDESIDRLLREKNYSFSNWQKNSEFLAATIKNSDVVFIDSYQASHDIYKEVSSLTKIPVFFDDTKRLNYPPGVILNGALSAELMGYPQKQNSRYLLGCRFTPIRKAFWSVPVKTIRENINDVLVTFGGFFQKTFVEGLMNSLLRGFPSFTYHVLIPQNSANNTFEKNTNLKIYSDLDDYGIRELMLKCDICISGGGQTTYELAAAGVPAIGICFAENQLHNLNIWMEKGYIGYSGWYNSENIFSELANAVNSYIPYKERLRRSNEGKKLIDGKGVKRIVDFVLAGFHLNEAKHKYSAN